MSSSDLRRFFNVVAGYQLMNKKASTLARFYVPTKPVNGCVDPMPVVTAVFHFSTMASRLILSATPPQLEPDNRVVAHSYAVSQALVLAHHLC
jgi:hypothetical protein